MFEMGFMELVLVSVIGLLVLGPKRLPKVAAEIGKWIGRARRTATQLRRQLEREIELSELETPPSPRSAASTSPASPPTPIRPEEPQPPSATDAEAAAHAREPTIGAPPEAPAGAPSRDLAPEPDTAARVDETEKMNG